MNRHKIVISAALFLLVLAISGCQGEKKETPTKGYVSVIVSEAVRPLMEQERTEFESLYPDAKVQFRYLPDRDAVVQLFNVDTVTTIVTTRPLTQEETAIAEKAKLNIADYKIAIDGVVIIVNPANPVTQLRTTQLDSILTGQITSWKQVGGTAAPIRVCLPSVKTGNFDLLQEKVLKEHRFAPAEAVAPSSEEMLKFVAYRRDAIGVIGLNRLAEMKDSVKVLALCDPGTPDSLGIRNKYFAPFQAWLYQGYYPLTRTVHIYSKADEYGVAAGFITFVANRDGQKIIQNNGLVPATMPVRLVELTNKGIQQ